MESKNVHLEIDPGLWREFKAACAHYDISMKATLIKHIQNIVNDYRMQKRFKPPSIIEPNKKGEK
ncbi:hypothetical protein ES703_70298 [subsurface metagenome]